MITVGSSPPKVDRSVGLLVRDRTRQHAKLLASLGALHDRGRITSKARDSSRAPPFPAGAESAAFTPRYGRLNEGIMPHLRNFPRPSSVASCQEISLKWALSAHRWGRSNAAKQCKNGCGMTQESATQWNHAPQTCYLHPLERTQRLGPRGMAITASRYNVLVKSTKIKGKYTKG